MTKPNAVEEIIARQLAGHMFRTAVPTMEGALDSLPKQSRRRICDAVRDLIFDLDAAGLAIVPHDWNHREEDWSLQSVSEWLER